MRRGRFCRNSPMRIVASINPCRAAILLLGGDKTSDDRFYEAMVRSADALYDEHLRELREEGLI